MATTTDSALKVLRGFFKAMHDWEWALIREDFADIEDWPAEKAEKEVEKRYGKLRQQMAKIFDRYCEVGVKARRVRDALHSGGAEPDYNPETERILSVTEKPGKIIVETQMAHNFQFRFKYEVVNVNGKWLLRDNRKCKAAGDEKWSRWDL